MSQRQWLAGALIAFCTCALLAPASGRADVVFDGTLGTAGAAPTRPLDGRTDWVIEQSRGVRVESGGRANLFHSFSTFDIDLDESASFLATDPVDTILARVTGGSGTTIAGRLRSEVPGADLFLIDPAGITFTETATLALPASFFVTSADFIRFEDGSTFASSGPPPSLTAAAPSAFGFLGGATAGPVIVEGERALTLARGSTFALVGGDVGVRDGSRIFSEGGRFDLAATGSAAVEVPLDLSSWTPRADGTAGLGSVVIDGNATSGTRASLFAFDLPNADSSQGRIVIRGGTFAIDVGELNAAGDGSAAPAIDIEATGSVDVARARLQSFRAGNVGPGGIRVHADSVAVRLITVSGIASFNGGSGDAGAIEIETGDLVLTDVGQIQSDATGSGAGADIVVRADRVSLDGGSSIQTDSTGPGRSGAVTITASRITGSNISEISSRTDGTGFVGNDAGAITIVADVLELDSGARISGTTDGSGRGADIDIDVADRLVLDGELVIGGGVILPSGIFARSGIDAGSPATGDGGTVTIHARSMTISNGAQIAASPRGEGSAGGIDIDVDETFAISGRGSLESGVFAQGVEGDGGFIEIDATAIELRDGARIESAALATGAGGDILLRAPSVLLDGDVQVNARSEGEGAAGSVSILGDSIRVTGGARILSLTEENGPAGDILLDAERVSIDDGALVSAESIRDANAGNITIQGGSAHVGTGAQILTVSNQRLGGNVTMNVDGVVAIDPGAEIATDVRGASGTGGDVVMNAESVVVNDADVTARAFDLNTQAGNIYISVRAGYFESTDAFVDASNDFGLDGTKVIDGPVNQVVGDLVTLDADFVDASSQLEEACLARDSASGSFSVQRERAPPPPPDVLLDPAQPPEPFDLENGSGRCEDAR